MKNKWIQLVVLLVVGIVFLVVGALMNGGIKDITDKFEKVEAGSQYVEFEGADLTAISDIEINIINGSVDIASENQEVYALACSNENVNDMYVKNGNTISIGYNEDTKRVLTTPVKTLEWSSKQLAQVVGSGPIQLKIPHDTHLGNVTINSEGSKVIIDNLDCDKLTINNTRGDVTIKKLNTATSAVINNTSGDVNVGEDGDDVNVVYGFTAKTTSGDINVYAQLMGTCAVETKRGTIDLHLNGSKSGYTLNTSLSINETNEAGDGSTDSKGNIKILGKKGKINVAYR